MLISAWLPLTQHVLAQDPLQQTVDAATGPGSAVETNSGDASTEATDDAPVETLVPDSVSVRPESDDESIRHRLSRILDVTGWFSDADVSVREGVVFLRGSTATEEHREWAAGLARSTEDVVAVVNRIEVVRSIDYGESMDLVTRSLEGMWEDFFLRLPNIVAGIVLLGLTWLAARLLVFVLRRVADRSRLRPSLQDLFAQLLTISVWICGLLAAAVAVFPGMTPSRALTVLGLGSVAVGFAFKDIFENFFAGILILWKFPFDKGDFIDCDGILGKVEDITIRMTNIRQVDGQLVVVPNALLFKNPVDVLTNRKSRRVTVICGVAYGEDVDQSRAVISDAVEACSSVDRQYKVEIFAQEFGDSGVNFEVTWWCGSTPQQERESRDEVVAAVKRALDQAGIEIPFPYRTLTFAGPLRTASLSQTEVGSATATGRPSNGDP